VAERDLRRALGRVAQIDRLHVCDRYAPVAAEALVLQEGRAEHQAFGEELLCPLLCYTCPSRVAVPTVSPNAFGRQGHRHRGRRQFLCARAYNCIMHIRVRPISASIWQRATITLRDGTPLAVRQIQPADAAALQRLHARLSACTSYRRFLHVLPELSEEQARSLANVYDFDGFALVALDPEQPDEIIAVARYARSPGTEQAELAVVVEDRWQGRGLGRALIHKLIDAARERGITSFSALVLRENTRALGLLKRLGLPERSRSVDGAVEYVEIDLRPEGLQTRLRAFWPGPRVPKTALAIALAWWGGQLLGEPQPIFAAIAALYGVQPTVAASLRKSGSQPNRYRTQGG
jgi:GNAT superfamily N-acetyltransferase